MVTLHTGVPHTAVTLHTGSPAHSSGHRASVLLTQALTRHLLGKGPRELADQVCVLCQPLFSRDVRTLWLGIGVIIVPRPDPGPCPLLRDRTPGCRRTRLESPGALAATLPSRATLWATIRGSHSTPPCAP